MLNKILSIALKEPATTFAVVISVAIITASAVVRWLGL